MVSQTSATLTTSTTLPASTSTSPFQNHFEAGTSTPYVLALLGLALAVVGFMIYMGWRRARLARVHTTQPNRILGIVSVEESPKLWDLWTEERTEGMRSPKTTMNGEHLFKEVAWENIMPITVTPSDNIVIATDNQVVQPQATPEPESVPFHLHELHFQSSRHRIERLAQLNESWRRLMHMQTAGRVHERIAVRIGSMNGGREIESMMLKEGRPLSSDNTDTEGHEDLQVVIAIAMPKPKLTEREVSRGLSASTEVEGQRLEMHNYDIGICRVPMTWDKVTCIFADSSGFLMIAVDKESDDKI